MKGSIISVFILGWGLSVVPIFWSISCLMVDWVIWLESTGGSLVCCTLSMVSWSIIL